MDPVEQTRQPFYEHRAFKGTAAVVALATALIALVGPLRNAVDGLSPEPTARTAWVQVVLNTTAAMGTGFGEGDGTRLDAAVSAVAKAVKELDNSAVGLRSTSARCTGESRRLIDLANGDSQEVIDSAKEQRPKGEASIVDAILGGLDEFNREPMRSHGPESRTLFVFTAASESCPWEDPTGEVERMLEEADPKRFGAIEVFALRPDDEQSAAAAPSTPGPRMVALETFVENDAELDVLEDLLGPDAQIHSVSGPAELYEQAEEAGEAVLETTERAEEEEGEEGEGGESGTSDEGGPQ